MTTEQKAKAYLEDLRKAKDLIEKISTELKESEDERIRKAIMGLTYLDGIEPILTKCSVTRSDILTYLEKQKINTEGDFGRGYDCGYKACLNSHGAEFFEKQKEPTTEELYAEAGTTEKEYIANTMKMVRNMREKQKEQKPTEWSEEDKKMLRTIISDGSRGVELDSKQISWFKSLRSHLHWKPSEEQMKALSETIAFAPDTFKPKCTLVTLQDDLKKLMEE